MAGKPKYKVGDIIGQRQIVEYCGSDPKHRVSLWKYQCLLCGAVVGPVRTATLTRRGGASMPRCCFDKNRAAGSVNPHWLGYGEVSKTYWNQCRYGAKRRGIGFYVTMKDMWDVFEAQNHLCALSGLHLVMGEDASLDRIDSNCPYMTNNIQWVHKNINRLKSNWREDEFIILCSLVSEYQKQKGRKNG